MSSYKRRLALFLLIGLTGISILPLLNFFVLKSVTLASLQEEGEWGRQLYTSDGIEGAINKKLASYGLSGRFHNAILGKEGFMFAGNAHLRTVQNHSGVGNYNYWVPIILTSLAKHSAYLQTQNVISLFVIAPDKESIYPEMLPDWYRPSENTLRNALVEQLTAQNFRFLDLTPLLQSHKNQTLYLKTDTHWNKLAGIFAYQEVMRQLDPELTVVPPVDMRPVEIDSGDLTRQLKFTIPKGDIDYEYLGKPQFLQPMITACKIKGALKITDCRHIPNQEVFLTQKPHIVYNPDALNKKTLLWIHDSFGNVYESMINASFSTVIHFHYKDLIGKGYYQLFEAFKPDYVLYQVVERQLEWIY